MFKIIHIDFHVEHITATIHASVERRLSPGHCLLPDRSRTIEQSTFEIWTYSTAEDMSSTLSEM